MKKLPIGIDDFVKLVEDGYYYVDKTMLIADLLEHGGEVVVLERPRRFGKTLTLQMLFHFFDISRAETSRPIFEKLAIGNTQYMSELGKYPAVFMSYKDIQARNMQQFRTNFHKSIRYYLSECSFLLDRLGPGDTEVFNDLVKNENSIFLNNALFFLTKFFSTYYNQRVVLLVDEIESLSAYCESEEAYEEMSAFLRILYSSVTKSNPYLKFCLMCGIMRSSREGYFTDVTNARFVSVVDEGFETVCGFTTEEVQTALAQYGLSQYADAVREWYGGYKFGGTEIYNPWSVVQFIAIKRFAPYWVQTSNDEVINFIFRMSLDTVYHDMFNLFNGESIRKFVFKSLPFRDLMARKKIWTLLLFNGYLTAEQVFDETGYCQLSLPNKETFLFFQNGFYEKFIGLNNLHFEELLNSLRGNNLKGENSFETNFQEIFKARLPEFTAENQEVFYYGMIGCMVLALKDEYKCYTNIEGKTEKIELILEPKDKNRDGFVFSFKMVGIGGSFRETMEEGLKGIDQKKYRTLFFENGVKRASAVAIAIYEDILRVSCVTL